MSSLWKNERIIAELVDLATVFILANRCPISGTPTPNQQVISMRFLLDVESPFDCRGGYKLAVFMTRLAHHIGDTVHCRVES